VNERPLLVATAAHDEVAAEEPAARSVRYGGHDVVPHLHTAGNPLGAMETHDPVSGPISVKSPPT
jgi:hypothetical protein